MTSAPGPARERTPSPDEVLIYAAACYAPESTKQSALAALARLAACAERGETLEQALRQIEEGRTAPPFGHILVARAALAGAAPEPAHEPRRSKA